MIRADHIAIDGDTAWWIPEFNPMDWWIPQHENRPCDRCHGTGRMLEDDDSHPACPDCHGTGRHTFTLDVECDECNESGKLGSDACWKCYAIGSKDITVHVVEVLPIYGRLDSPLPAGVSKWVWHSPNDLDADRRGTFLCEIIDNETQMTAVNLPAAAAPGMWAVRLAIHKENS